VTFLVFNFGLRDEKRNWLFLRGAASAGMVVLQEDHEQWPTQHFACDKFYQDSSRNNWEGEGKLAS
jgi:hypothetical protein